MLRGNKSRYIGIIIFNVILDMILHIIVGNIFTVKQSKAPSILVKAIGTETTALLWLFISFSTVAYVFYKLKNEIDGNNIEKGFRFSGAVVLLWFWGVIESTTLLGTSLIVEVAMGLCDAIPIGFMILLLSKFTIDKSAIEEKSINLKDSEVSVISVISTILVFTFVTFIGRYIFYITKIIESGFDTKVYGTIVWTALMGVCIGVIYLLLGECIKSEPLIRSSLKFGLIIFGVNWTIFQIFIIFIYEGTLVDIILRCTIDIILASLGYYISESIRYRYFRKSKNILTFK